MASRPKAVERTTTRLIVSAASTGTVVAPIPGYQVEIYSFEWAFDAPPTIPTPGSTQDTGPLRIMGLLDGQGQVSGEPWLRLDADLGFQVLNSEAGMALPTVTTWAYVPVTA